VVGWFESSAPALYAPQRFPVFQLDVPEGRFYGFPEWGVPGVKLGLYHHRGERVTADTVRRETDALDEAALRSGLGYLPHAQGRMLSAKVRAIP
jgi:sarcosine oxidase